MAKIRIQATLPYFLFLPDGEYPCGQGRSLFFSRRHGERDSRIYRDQREVVFYSDVHSFFEVPEGLASDGAYEAADREAKAFVGQMNRLLRWYRVRISRQAASDVAPDVPDITLEQLETLTFTKGTGGPWLWLHYGPRRDFPIMERAQWAEFSKALREDMASGGEPDPNQVTVSDAEHALRVGRFREAVLLSWCVIDASVSRTFDTLVDEKLSEEWEDGRKHLKGADFGLRHKMSTGLRLLCGITV